MKSALGYLAVVVPPDIIDYETSHDMTVDEGQNVTLTCTAVGLPEPTIEWRREGRKPLMSIGSEESLYNTLHNFDKREQNESNTTIKQRKKMLKQRKIFFSQVVLYPPLPHLLPFQLVLTHSPTLIS